MSRIHVVVPDGFDDVDHPTGGNIYDRRLCDGLRTAGWEVTVHTVAGSWPHPGPEMLAALARIVAGLPGEAALLVDGLIASTAPGVLVPQAGRLRLFVLMHLPLGVEPQSDTARAAEGAVLSVARSVLTTSRWTRDRLLELYRLAPERVAVARPGVDPAALAPGSDDGSALLCVAAVAAHKGYDVLLDALADLGRRRWKCLCLGALHRDPGYVRRLIRQRDADGLGERVTFGGLRTGADLDRAYAGADLLIVPSRVESFGMVITEALARGVPVIASSVGGTGEAMGATGDGRRPGVLVPPDDPRALADALREWLDDGELRERLRTAARQVRPTLPGWAETTATVAAVVSSLS